MSATTKKIQMLRRVSLLWRNNWVCPTSHGMAHRMHNKKPLWTLYSMQFSSKQLLEKPEPMTLELGTKTVLKISYVACMLHGYDGDACSMCAAWIWRGCMQHACCMDMMGMHVAYMLHGYDEDVYSMHSAWIGWICMKKACWVNTVGAYVVCMIRGYCLL